MTAIILIGLLLIAFLLYLLSNKKKKPTTEAPVTTISPSTAWTVRYSTDLGDLCFQPTQTVYTAVGKIIEPDTFVFTDAGLTTPLLGFNFIVELVATHIYNMNGVTGQVQLPTLTNC